VFQKHAFEKAEGLPAEGHVAEVRFPSHAPGNGGKHAYAQRRLSGGVSGLWKYEENPFQLGFLFRKRNIAAPDMKTMSAGSL